MLIGLVSDTHDRLPQIALAVKKLNEMRVERVLHAGDYVSPFVLPAFSKLKGKMRGVFGNNDGDIEHLKNQAQATNNIELQETFANISIENVDIGLLHGHQTSILRIIIESGKFDLVVHGHTHKPKISQMGKTLVVNPGEVCGYLTGTSTCAIFNTESLKAEIIEV
jgi:putative phosphoesterase